MTPRFIDIVDGVPSGQPYSKPQTMPVPAIDGSLAIVGSGHWPPEAFAAFGKVPVEGIADPATEIETGFTYIPEAGVARPIIAARPAAEIRTKAVAAIKATADALLTPTDWLAIRASETAAPIPAATVAYRGAVRAASNAAEAAILAAGDDAAAILALIPEWPELPASTPTEGSSE
jgi:hypothetical protein